jgi:hypothetical protein
MDMELKIIEKIEPMEKIIIIIGMVEKHIKNMTNGKTPGLDGLKTELWLQIISEE